MYDLISNYGLYALTLLLSGLGWLLTRFLLVLIESKQVRGYVAALWDETRAAVLEVGQTYVDALKAAKLNDGKLTPEEAAEAKKMAIAIAKSNLGTKGLKRLAKVFNVEDWIGNKVEAIIGAKKEDLAEFALPPKPEA